MVYTGWKRPGAFKVTVKAGGAPTPAGGEAPPEEPKEEVERDNGGPTIPVRFASWPVSLHARSIVAACMQHCGRTASSGQAPQRCACACRKFSKG
jgi:hypothetical protein